MPSVQTGSLNSDARRKGGISVIQVGEIEYSVTVFSQVWKGVAGWKREWCWSLKGKCRS